MAIEQLFEIRINSSELNKDKGFDILMNSGLSIICLEDEKYVVPFSAIELLKKERVEYENIKRIQDNAPSNKA